ncbi:hypothetical protein AWC38_SpisGene21582 [Stylophora pistillata]|uniref:Uncharacterized protein n=1 Tax=Stylophora pistillata TaxID=50429 RepID=A0A2B4R9F3_STYPI|nr:hypothetical protein AWC38_SpisGene21582 [Stylophora pistillata]
MDSELEDDSEKLSKAIPVLSDYVKGLETRVKERYLAKLSVIGVDQASIPKEQFNGECLSPIEVSDLLGYLVLETSHHTRKEFKAYKSLNAYNQMVSGFVQSITPPTTSTSLQGLAMAADSGSESSSDSEAEDSVDDDVTVTNVVKCDINKQAPLANLTTSDYQIILNPTGWLTCDIVQKAQEVVDQTNDLLGGRLNSLNYAPVQQQNNGNDCGIFAIAFACFLANGGDPRQRISPITLSTWIRTLAMPLVSSTSMGSNCFNPLMKTGITSLACFRLTLSEMVKPLSAITKSPGSNFSKKPQFSVEYLSDVRPPHALDT